MDMQHELFEPAASVLPCASEEDSSPSLTSLAVPCGWRNIRNEPCQRLGWRPMQIDGVPLFAHGQMLLQCEWRCWSPTSVDCDMASETNDFGGSAADGWPRRSL